MIAHKKAGDCCNSTGSENIQKTTNNSKHYNMTDNDKPQILYSYQIEQIKYLQKKVIELESEGNDFDAVYRGYDCLLDLTIDLLEDLPPSWRDWHLEYVYRHRLTGPVFNDIVSNLETRVAA